MSPEQQELFFFSVRVTMWTSIIQMVAICAIAGAIMVR